MKNLSLPLTLVALFALSACGSNLKSEKRPSPVTAQAQTNEWGASLEEGCKSRNGQFFRKEKLCIHTALAKDLAGGASGKSEELTSLEITAVNPGQAVLATGTATEESVQIALDGQVISAIPSSGNKPVTLGKGGKLEFQLKPGGYFDEVKVYVYSCVDESFREVRCPY
jgi:hypothetical protein